MKMKRKSGIQTSEDMREDLECPVCLKIPRNTPIYQCDKGHIHCKTCHPRLNRCPICRSSIGDTRSLMAEKIISRLPTKCNFEDYGCTEPEKLPEEMSIHEKSCYFRMVKCIKSSCKETFVLAEAIEHFTQKHPHININQNAFKEAITTFKRDSEEISKRSSWTPVHLQCKDRHFLVSRRQNEHGYFAISVYILGSEEESKDFTCTIKAHNKVNNTKLLAMESMVHPIDCKNVSPSLVLHIRQIKEMMNENRQIMFEISINHIEDITKDGLIVQDDISTKFIQTCYENDLKSLAQLLLRKDSNRINFNAKVKNGRTGFMIACHQGSLQVVKKLVQLASNHDIDFDASDDFGLTALMMACNENHFDIVKHLLTQKSAQIDFNARGDEGETAFMIACYYGHKEIVELFLDSKVEIDLEAEDNNGDTAFTMACQNQNREIVDLLIRNVNTCHRNKGGESGFDIWPEINTFLHQSLKSINKPKNKRLKLS